MDTEAYPNIFDTQVHIFFKKGFSLTIIYINIIISRFS